jgi:hypothetical protein
MLSLPKSLVFSLAQDSIEIKDGILYQVRKDGSLSESESLEYLETLYKEEHADEIDDFQTKNIQNYMDKNIRNKKLNLKAIQEQLAKSRANTIVFKEIIPRISGETLLGNINLEVKQDTDKPVDVTKYAEYQEYEETKKRYETRAVLKNPKFHKTADRSIMGRYVLSGFDVKIIKGRVYNGNALLMSLDDAEIRFQELLQKELLVEAVKNLSKRNKELARIEGQEEALKKIMEKESFSGKQGGFMKRGDKTYIFWMNFPAFINKFPNNGRYYRFPAGKIKIDATYDSGDFDPKQATIRADGDYIHPYTEYNIKNGDRLLCTDEKVDDIKKESGRGWAKMIEMLLVGKKTLMSSFNSRMYNPEDWYRKHNYNKFEISESAARNGKTPITNINILGE